MRYRYESYLKNICVKCNELTGRNYFYKLDNYTNAKIEWFENGKLQSFHFDVELYMYYLKYSIQMVAEMVVL